jgi:hypothetical protein
MVLKTKKEDGEYSDKGELTSCRVCLVWYVVGRMS